MSRELKFRAWDKVDGMKHFSLEDFAYIARSIYHGVYDVPVMQWTGLTDRNGVDVYEGDIVKCSVGCPHKVEWRSDYGGTYNGGMPAFYLSGLKNGYSWTGDEEVIGNIHNDSDLLGGGESDPD